jgi:hypothetical protein
MRRPHDAGWVVIAALLLASSGCDPHAGAPPVSGSMEEATVKGTVKIRGKPVNGGSIVFSASNFRRPNAAPRTAAINKDGTYTVKALVGENSVEIECKELLTPKNREFKDQVWPATVASGECTIDFDLPQLQLPQPK